MDNLANFIINEILEPIAKVIRPNISRQDAAELGIMFLGLGFLGLVLLFGWAMSNR